VAINPSIKYSLQVDTSDPVGWPYGRAQNESAPSARNGTPLEQEWIADLWGFQQALLSAAELVPTNSADKAGPDNQDSQYLQAIRSLNFRLVFPLPTAVHDDCDFTPGLAGLAQTIAGGAFIPGSQVNIRLGPLPHSTAARRTYLKSVSVHIAPVSHSNMPANKPGFRVYRTSAAGALDVNGTAFTDPSTTLAEYNVPHVIPGSLTTPLEITSDMALSVGFYGEYGTNAVTGLQVLGVSCVLSDRPF